MLHKTGFLNKIQTAFNLIKSKTLLQFSGLSHTQGIQGNSGNFQVVENLRETQGDLRIFYLFFYSGNF